MDGIAVGKATFRATTHAFEYEEAEPIAAKGKAEPVPVWIVLGEKAAPKRPEPWRRLVGREGEIAQLSTLWDRRGKEAGGRKHDDKEGPESELHLSVPRPRESELLLVLSNRSDGRRE